ncbi:two component transcriptional regulator, LytTR family [Zhouia amylolytica]|uniref:Two-component system response regulator n=2 Tax=Zhouia amylolytica TaxID=376730 RepID=W2UK06_9FLAO|nr:response regulator transcription factor [Zhouia amylolytica]ETN94328.1 two-component system response regulator [Zhouia amylolytica AD3]MCQ0110442.1 response regulator transcription factor [Zhouia amylolytica]SFT15347.1 two component transcriptional regulator, LytTR family [Zhouia amylolytica]
MKLKCVIIDDEPLAVNVIKNYVSQINSLELLCTFNSAIESMDYLQKNEVDLVFLDINMPLLNGLDFIQNLQNGPLIIITTAHEEYAVKSYELEVLDYLVKPIPFNRFLKAVNKAQKENESSSKEPTTPEKDFIFVKIDKKKLKKVYLDDILAIESLKDYIKIITKTSKYIVHQTLTSFTEDLPSERFIRIHRSYTISIDKVDVIEGNSVEIDGIRYTIGRSYLNDVKRILLDGASDND